MAETTGGRRIRVDLKDLIAGVLLFGLAAAFAIIALRRLALGQPSSMGPGFFPLMIAVALGGLALAIAIRAFGREGGSMTFAGPRALACILLAPAAFGLAVGPLGFIPAVALACFLAAWASRLMTVRYAMLLTLFLTVLCAAIFVFMLRMPVSLFGPWLGS
jgi:hypothetical protein